MQTLLIDPIPNSLQILKEETDSWICKPWLFSLVKANPTLHLTVL